MLFCNFKRTTFGQVYSEIFILVDNIYVLPTKLEVVCFMLAVWKGLLFLGHSQLSAILYKSLRKQTTSVVDLSLRLQILYRQHTIRLAISGSDEFLMYQRLQEVHLRFSTLKTD